jgi:hypothetical protein
MGGRLICVLAVLVLTGCRLSQGNAPPVAPDAEAPAPARYHLAWVTPDGELVRADVDFADPRTVAEGVYEAAPSADGARVAYADSEEGVGWVNLLSGETERVAAPHTRDPWQHLAISPDGQRVAYISMGRVKVWTRGRETITIEGPRFCTSPAWAPDSTRLAVGTMAKKDAEDEDGGIWVWSGDGAAEHVVPAIKDGWGCTQQVMWSPDGEWLATARGAGDGWTGDLVKSDGSEIRRDAIGAGPIQWRPDSSGLLVSVHIEAGAFRTGYYDLVADKLTPFGGEDDETLACLSADGAHALVTRPRAEGPALLVDLNTGEQREWGSPVAGVAVWGPHDVIALAAQVLRPLQPAAPAPEEGEPEIQVGTQMRFLDRDGHVTSEWEPDWETWRSQIWWVEVKAQGG